MAFQCSDCFVDCRRKVHDEIWRSIDNALQSKVSDGLISAITLPNFVTLKCFPIATWQNTSPGLDRSSEIVISSLWPFMEIVCAMVFIRLDNWQCSGFEFIATIWAFMKDHGLTSN